MARYNDIRRARGRSSNHHAVEVVDVVVVGARCAGAATALLLARAGHDVLMLDRSSPARDTNSTHSLVRGGVVQLARWGLLETILATGAPQIRSVAFHAAGLTDRRPVKDRAGVDFLLAPRRYVIDDVIARAAVDAGAALRTDTTVTGVLRDTDGRVAGVTARDAAGTVREIRARLVVGADGVHSHLAKHVGAEVVERHPTTGAAFYAYVGGTPWDGFELEVSERAFAGIFPTHHGEACVWLMRPEADLAPVIGAGAERQDRWLAALAECAPVIAHKVRGGALTTPLRGAMRLANHVRRAAGPGWALVGDAGYHRDPITGHGMTDAFRDAELLAEAIDAVLRHEPEGAALAGYERQRNAALADTFALTRALGAFPPVTEFLELQTRYARSLETEAQVLAARPAPVGGDQSLVDGVA